MLAGNRERCCRTRSGRRLPPRIERLESRQLLSAGNDGIAPVGITPAEITPGEFMPVPTAVGSPRQMEALGRGVVAMYRGSGNVYLSWRLLGDDPSNISFNVYRVTGTGSPVKRNVSPITATTDFTDTGANSATSGL